MKEAIKLSIICMLTVAIIAFPYIGGYSFILSIIYYGLFFLPILPFIIRLNVSVIEKFVLANLAGLSYLTIAAMLDSALKIKLTKFIFIIIPLMIFIIGLRYNKNHGDKK